MTVPFQTVIDVLADAAVDIPSAPGKPSETDRHDAEMQAARS